MSEIVPDDFDLDEARGKRSSTDNKERKRCPNCHHLNIVPHVHGTFEDAKYRCNVCSNHFDELVYGLLPEGGE